MKLYAVAVVLVKEDKTFSETKVTTALTLWSNLAHSEEEAKGRAIESAFKGNEGFKLSMVLASEIPISEEEEESP